MARREGLPPPPGRRARRPLPQEPQGRGGKVFRSVLEGSIEHQGRIRPISQAMRECRVELCSGGQHARAVRAWNVVPSLWDCRHHRFTAPIVIIVASPFARIGHDTKPSKPRAYPRPPLK